MARKRQPLTFEPDRQLAGTAKVAPHDAPQSATPREAPKLKQVGARIPEDLYRQLKSIAALKGEPVRIILEAMIADYLHQHQQKV